MRSTSEFERDEDVGGVTLRPLRPGDGAAARALVERQFAGTRYLPRLLEQVGLALTFMDVEYRGVVAFDTADAGSPLGVLLFGCVAGASGVVKLQALLGDHEDALRLLLAMVDDGCMPVRLLFCEVADDDVFAPAVRVLLANGYCEESRADAFVGEGVALRFLVQRPDASDEDSFAATE